MEKTEVDKASFQYYFVENDKDGKNTVAQWGVFFNKSSISIEDFARKTKFCMKFVEGEDWNYSLLQTIEGSYTVCRGAQIVAKNFTLSVYVHEFKNSKINPPEGSLDLITNSIITSISLPYKLALNIMTFMSGSTDVVGVSYVRK